MGIGFTNNDFTSRNPRRIIARTKRKYIREFSSVANTAAATGAFWDAVKETMVKAGWTSSGAELTSANYSPSNGDPALYDSSWYNGRIILSYRQSGASLFFKLRPAKDDGYDHSREFKLAYNSSWRVFVDPFSLHIVPMSAGEPYQAFLSASTIHVPEVLRDSDTADYLQTSYYITNAASLFSAGGVNEFGTYASWGGLRRNSAYFSSETGGLSAPQFCYTTYDGRLAKFKTLIGPAIMAWGATKTNQLLLRGFSWNMVFLIGTVDENEKVQTDDGNYLIPIMALNDRVTLCWVTK